MNATDLLAELRPAPHTPSTDEMTLERILLAAPEPPEPPRPQRYRRPLAAAAVAAFATTAAVALAPSGGGAPAGLERAVAALTEPQVLLHFKVQTTHLPSGATERAERGRPPTGAMRGRCEATSRRPTICALGCPKRTCPIAARPYRYEAPSGTRRKTRLLQRAAGHTDLVSLAGERDA